MVRSPAVDERRDPQRVKLRKLLSSQARVWGKLSLLHASLVDLEKDLEAARARVLAEDEDVARLERPGLTRLKAMLRGKLPTLLEKESREAAAALTDYEALGEQLALARKQRDRLERHLAQLREKESEFGEALVQRVRDQLEEAPDRRGDDEVARLGDDLEDLEATEEALESLTRALEEARDALASIEPPSFLSVISGMALLDLFEAEPVLVAREALRRAKEDARRARHALETLEETRPPRTAMALLEELEGHRFLDFLYHEGKIAKVLAGAGEAVEGFRSRVWDARARIHALKDGLLVKLGELEDST